MSFFKHRLRHVPEWEEAICVAGDSGFYPILGVAMDQGNPGQEERPMFCSTSGSSDSCCSVWDDSKRLDRKRQCLQRDGRLRMETAYQPQVDPEAGRIEPTKSPLRPYHYNCVDEPNVASGKDCRVAGVC